ncbi:MAG: hypothetical protein JOY62_05270 [Acidobacteriaceae bacterium]|nr:hypothetical protein [Acidobacteriaceae bacterium]MBV9779366.1 hypothetical protein [Acidobacteriaceae bacterium]
MMKFFFATLLAISSVYGADAPSAAGTWKLNLAKSNYSSNPNGAPREATLTITDNGWTYTATDASGKKSDFSSQGNDTITVKVEPTGNPYLHDTRFVVKESGKEVQRTVGALLPDGKTLVSYSSGVTPDGKAFSDVSYWERVP